MPPPDASNEVTILALKIFGIYSPTELDTELWNVVGKQLVSLRGKEYGDRY
jgi:hypothetical protein